MLQGEVVYQFVYDTGGEIDLDRVGDLLNAHPAFEPLEITKTAPKWVELPKPLVVRFPPVTRPTNLGPQTFRLEARVYRVGAVGFSLRAPFAVESLNDLLPYGNLKHRTPTGDLDVESITRAFYEEMQRGLADAIVEPYAVTIEPENYVVYAITSLPGGVENARVKERRALAGLLAGEADPARLAEEEIEDNLRYWFRYYDDDSAIVDWDYAIVVEPTGKYGDLLTLFEIVNVQLLELRVYDRLLDNVLDKAYVDLSKFYARGGLFKSARDLQQTLSDVNLDLQRITDAVDNIGKIFGDWYFAKVYAGTAERFHLADWELSIREKLNTLRDLYGLATHEVEHRRAMVLEGMIVLLFVLDLALLFLISR